MSGLGAGVFCVEVRSPWCCVSIGAGVGAAVFSAEASGFKAPELVSETGFFTGLDSLLHELLIHRNNSNGTDSLSILPDIIQVGLKGMI